MIFISTILTPTNITLTIVILFIVYFIAYFWHQSLLRKKPAHRQDLSRHDSNPIMSPRPHQEWESGGTFNPAAVTDNEGTVHLLYRAVGDDGVSRIGHASSRDGKHIDSRSSFPVYQPSRGYGMPDPNTVQGPLAYDPTSHRSGGGWAGCEDPRAVKIEDRIYVTYTAFEGWNSVRIGVTSISEKDLRNNRWNWKKPKIISSSKQVNKNWVIFPEKIKGKFVILHSISPRILVDYVDSLSNPYSAETIFSQSPKGGRATHWDNWMRGAGAPPIKTDKGWLLLYHAMDRNDPDKYKLGAMLLDLNDPTVILYRSPKPILEPNMSYENDSKAGVVYASGAVIKNGNLLVYYGGGDRHVCVAETPLQALLEWLTRYGKIN